ncbi:MAG: Smr/MutS family protein [Pseudomonadota bacterium]
MSDKSKRKRQNIKKNKNGLLKLDSNFDFLKAFESTEPYHKAIDHKVPAQREQAGVAKPQRIDKHGLPVLNTDSLSYQPLPNEDEEDFKTLLEQSFVKKTTKPLVNAEPMPIKKRIKRYPPVEMELDLHGCTAMEAQAKTRSFIQNSKQLGYFTIRIIVGRGRHSQMGPILPDVVEDLVVDIKKQGQILFFEWDKKIKSRSGALIVYLKQFEQFD